MASDRRVGQPDNLAPWGVEFVAASNVVDRPIRRLRIKVPKDWHKPWTIATGPGQAYLFVPLVKD